jgi:hypothetical protein
MSILSSDWEFNVLGVYNYRRPGKLSHYFSFIEENFDRVEGDIVEAGVFQGRSLLATAMFLKEIGSSAQVYGFDSFAGFPPVYHEYDRVEYFKVLYEEGRISDEHYKAVEKNIILRGVTGKTGKNPADISTSGDFSNTSAEDIERKIEFLGLDNVHIVKGSFDDTFVKGRERPVSIMAALVDCDLYESYRVVLPFVWSRLSKGGYVFLDEYYSLKFPGARVATDEFFMDKGDKPQMHVRQKGEFERWFVRKIFD